MPPPARVTTYYADAACTLPLIGGEALSPQRCLGAAGRQLSPAQAAVASDGCAPVAQAVTLGAAFNGTLYQSGAGGCQGVVGVSSAFQIGGELQMSRFVGGKLVTE